MVISARFIKFAALIIALTGLAYGALYLNSGRFVAKGIYVGDHLAQGLTRQELTNVVASQAEQLKSFELHFEAEPYVYQVTRSGLGIDFDVQGTVERIFRVGKSFWFKAQAIGFGQTHHFQPVLKADAKIVREHVEQKLSESVRSVQNAVIVWAPDTGWRITPALFGREIADGEIDRITKLILDGVYDLDSARAHYRVRTKRIEPVFVSEDLDQMLKQAKKLSVAPVQIKFGKINETLDILQDPSKWFVFDYNLKQVQANQKQIASFVANFAARYDIDPSEVKIQAIETFPSEYVDETYQKAGIIGDFRSGRKIDQSKMIADLSNALLSADKRFFAVDFSAIPTKIISQVPGFDFFQLLSVGQSSYSLGNYANRVHNIKYALSFQDLTVVPAGEIFSYNKILGFVTIEKGYKNAHVIFGDQALNAPGGGVCQTSTTLFRAAVNAGLPIVERRNHSWDVVYYRDWYGMDAAVYPPGRLDIKFLNDTPGPLLIHSYTDDDNEIAYFEIYGTWDGREVRIEMVENIRIGAGRRIVMSQEITHPDGIIEKRTIVSRYKQ